MGSGCLAGHGGVADRVAWLLLWNSATRLRLGLFAWGPRLLRHLQCLWPQLAGHVRGWDPSRPAGPPDSDGCARIRGLGAPESRTTIQWGWLLAKRMGFGQTPSLALPVRDCPDDGLQLDVAWYPGQLPDLPAKSDPAWV